MGIHSSYDPDDDDSHGPAKKKHTDWDCPGCNANNPGDPAIVEGDEVSCNYCGTTFLAKFTDDGRIKFKEL